MSSIWFVARFWLVGLVVGLALAIALRAAGLDLNPGTSLGGAGGLGLVLGLSRLAAKRRREAAAAARLLVPDPICLDEQSGGFGRERPGKAPWVGSGCLALSREALVFVTWSPRATLTIPVENFLRVEETRTHLGKTVRYPLLKLTFADSDGSEDAIAWLVRDVERWRTELEALCPRG